MATTGVSSNSVSNAPATVPDSETATVQSSESTLSQVALRLGVSEDSLKAANPGINPKALQPGREIKLPKEQASASETPQSAPNASTYSRSAAQSKLAENNFGTLARQLQFQGVGITPGGGTSAKPLNQQLIEASESGDLKLMDDLIKKGGDVNFKDVDGRTPLMHAAEKGNTKAVEKLVKDYKADINATDKNGQNALMKAAIMNHDDSVKSLIGLKARVDDFDRFGRTPLIYASRQGNADVVKTLLKQGKADPNISDEDYRTALMESAKKGDTQSAKELINHNADVNAQDRFKRTALMDAVETGNGVMIRGLAKRSDPDIKDSNGDTNLMHLVGNGPPEKPADPVAVRALIVNSKNLDAKDKDGNTALILAGKTADGGALKALMDAGADPNLQDKDGKNALMGLIESRQRLFKGPEPFDEGIKVLIDRTDLNMRDTNGQTAVRMAVNDPDLFNTVAELRDKGADLNIADRSGITPLMEASAKGLNYTVRALLDRDWQAEGKKAPKKADAFLRDNNHGRALEMAEKELRALNQNPAADPIKKLQFEEIIKWLKEDMDV